MALHIPLTPEQIKAANRLYHRVPQWKTVDNALDALKQQFPDFDAESVLLKVVAINALYQTNVYAGARMAKHVEDVMGRSDLSSLGLDLVEELAALPPSSNREKPRRHVSFAAKFAHFFIDAERFPIMDSYAVNTINYHLRKADRVQDTAHPYRAFVANFDTPRELSGHDGTPRELDRYLYLSGVYRAWRENPDRKISRAFKGLFENKPQGAAAELEALLPSIQDSDLVP